MNRLRYILAATVAAVPQAAVGLGWGGWAALALPSGPLYRLGEPLSIGLWQFAPRIADALEPASRALPPAFLTGLGPAAALATAAWAFKARRPAYGAAGLLASAAWGLAPLREAATALAADLPTAAMRLDGVIGWLQQEYGGSLAIGLLALAPLAAPPLRKAWIIEPIRRERNTGRAEADAWAAPELIRHLADSQGMPLGRRDGAILRYPSSDPAEILYQGHHFIIAATRSGKGVGAVIPAILDNNGPITCIDIKGQNFAVCKAAREKKGFKAVALNPFNVLSLGSIGLNPFIFLPPNDLDTGAAALAVSLIREESVSGADHFIRLARALVAAAIEVVATVAEPADRHLVTVLDLLCGPGAADAFAAWVAAPSLCGGRPARAVSSFMGHDTKERDMVISTIRANIGFIGGDKMQKFFKSTENSLTPDDVLNGKTDIFIILPLDQISAQPNFFRLIVSLLMNTIMGSEKRKLARPMLMVLDEFPVLGAMDQVKDLFTIGAGSNIELLAIAQDIARLRDVWGPLGASSLLSQSATIRILGLGAGDIDTSELISKLMPRITVKKESKSFDAEDLISDRATYSETEPPLMTPDEVLKMPSDVGLCLIRGHNPLLFEKITYYSDPAYCEIASPDPYHT